MTGARRRPRARCGSPCSARTLTAQQLEQGDAGLSGRLGDGAGKWQLFVSAGRPIQVMSLLTTPTGHLTNLSTVTGEHIIRGSAGGDELWGGNGDDIIHLGDNAEPIGDDRGFDTVHGSTGDDMMNYTDSGPNGYQQLLYSGLDAGGIRVTIDGVANRATVDKGPADTDTLVNIANPLNADNSGGFELAGTRFDDVFDLTLDDGQWMDIQGNAGTDTFNILSDEGRSGSITTTPRTAWPSTFARAGRATTASEMSIPSTARSGE